MLELELHLLPWLAASLPTSIPVPCWRGTMDERGGWLFLGHKFIPGVTLCDADPDHDERAALAPRLANFVRALHHIDPQSAPQPLPGDDLGRLDFDARIRSTRSELANWQRDGLLPYALVVGLFRRLDEWPGPPRDEPSVVLHADLHSRNLLITQDGRLSGVIDWVDLHVGPAATDLSCGYKLFPPDAREVFFDTYGGVARATRARARFRAIDHSTRALAGAIERRDEALVKAATLALTFSSIGD